MQAAVGTHVRTQQQAGGRRRPRFGANGRQGSPGVGSPPRPRWRRPFLLRAGPPRLSTCFFPHKVGRC